MSYSVYCHLNKTNGKMYFGQTICEPKSRWGSNGIRYRVNEPFWLDIQKYGWDGFEHIVLYDSLTSELANYFEKMLISDFNTTDNDYGYNHEEGGVGGYSVLSDVREKISDTLKDWYKTPGNEHPMQGKHHTDETKQKMRQAKLGRHLSEEHKKKIGLSSRGRNIGRKASEETRLKQSVAKKGKVWVTNDQETKLILPSEVDNYLAKGYRLGFKKNNNKGEQNYDSKR